VAESAEDEAKRLSDSWQRPSVCEKLPGYRPREPQGEKHARDHALLLLLVVGVLVMYAIAGVGIYSLIQVVA